MFSYVRRVAAKLSRHVGMNIRHTYLYRLSKPDDWSPAVYRGSLTYRASLTWELLSPAQVARLEGVGWFDLHEYLQRFQRGDRCYTVSIDGRIAHYSWVQRSGSHPITDAGLSVRVENGAFWIYHCLTAEWAQRRGMYSATLEKIVNDCFAEGYCTAWIYTARPNVASQKGIARAGFGLVTTLRALRMGSHYLPIRGSDRALVELLRSQAGGLPERRRDPAPAFVSPTLVDRRRGQLDRETGQIAARHGHRVSADDTGQRQRPDRRQFPVGPVG